MISITDLPFDEKTGAPLGKWTVVVDGFGDTSLMGINFFAGKARGVPAFTLRRVIAAMGKAVVWAAREDGPELIGDVPEGIRRARERHGEAEKPSEAEEALGEDPEQWLALHAVDGLDTFTETLTALPFPVLRLLAASQEVAGRSRDDLIDGLIEAVGFDEDGNPWSEDGDSPAQAAPGAPEGAGEAQSSIPSRTGQETGAQ